MVFSSAHAEPAFVPTTIDPDPPSRQTPSATANAPSWDLDGFYLWLGPTGAASHLGEWDSTFGAHLAAVRVREHERIGTIGGSVGASRWTEQGGYRIWMDALVGTRLGRMVGISAGPILELPELKHPQLGGSVGLWAFVGVAPFVRVGQVRELGTFVELGVHIALPVLHRR